MTARITILHDAFGSQPGLAKEWGFAALVELGGKRILFDTGNSSPTFAANCNALGVDLADLDCAVISHRHGDHTSGLGHLLEVNPRLTIHTPDETYGVFGSSLFGNFYPRCHTLPQYFQYYDGEPPEVIRHGSAWPPGIERILEAARPLAPRVSCIVGGLHLVLTPEPEVRRRVSALRDEWKVERMAPGHCTGEPGFAAIRDLFGDRCLFAGLGETVELGA